MRGRKDAARARHPGLLPPFEARVRHNDGTYRTFEVKANNLLDDPAVQGIIVNSRDITERVEAERALRENERHYRTIVETANEGIWIIDADAITTFVNRRMSELLGIEPSRMIGRHINDFLDEDTKPLAAGNLERRRAGVAGQYDMKVRRADGTFFWAMVSASPLDTPTAAHIRIDRAPHRRDRPPKRRKRASAPRSSTSISRRPSSPATASKPSSTRPAGSRASVGCRPASRTTSTT